MGNIFSSLMGGGGGGGGGSRTNTTSVPWEPWQPFLTDVYGHAQELYDQGAPGFWQGTANAPLTQQMQDAMGMIWNRATSGSPALEAGRTAVSNIASGSERGTNPAYNFLQGSVYGGNQNPAMGYAQSLLGGPNTAGIDALQREASGANVGQNPWLTQTYQQAADDLGRTFRETTVPQLQSDYALSGRTGSHAYADALGKARGSVMDSATKLATNLYGQAYNTDRGIQAAAAQALPGAYSQDFQNRIGAGNFLSGVYDTGLQRQLYGAQMLGQLGQQDVGNVLQAANMTPGMAAADWVDLGQVQNAANFYQQRAQDEQNLARQAYEYQAQAPMNWLNNYAQLIYGSPTQNFGNTSSTTRPITNQGAGIGSMVGAGLGLASSFFGVPPQIGMSMGSSLGGMVGGQIG